MTTAPPAPTGVACDRPPSDAPRSAAARIAGRAAAVVGAALVLAALTLPWRPPTLCFLRSLTGIPCPFCGGTTAMVQLGQGRPLAALAASPLATLGAPLWVVWPALTHRWRRVTARVSRGRLLAAGGAVLAASWLWQLERVLG
jgi:hypothetical protein